MNSPRFLPKGDDLWRGFWVDYSPEPAQCSTSARNDKVVRYYVNRTKPEMLFAYQEVWLENGAGKVFIRNPTFGPILQGPGGEGPRRAYMIDGHLIGWIFDREDDANNYRTKLQQGNENL